MAIRPEQRISVIELRNKGYTYNQIETELGVSGQQARDFCRTLTARIMGVREIKRTPTQLPKKHICEICGAKYMTKESDISSQKYCSSKCKDEAIERRKQETILKRTKQCKKCGKDFISFSNMQEYCNSCKTLTLVCETCGKEFKRANKSVYREQKYCSKKCEGKAKSKSHEQWYMEFSKIHKGQIVPIQKYEKGSDDLTVLCLECGKETTRKAELYIDRRRGCKHCGYKLSIGEDLIEHWLINNNIDYETQFTFNDLIDKQPLRFDFAILTKDKSLKLLIEYDGIQHFEIRKQFGGKQFLEEQQEHDRMKNEYAINNNIYLVRISYTQQGEIENILNDIVDRPTLRYLDV